MLLKEPDLILTFGIYCALPVLPCELFVPQLRSLALKQESALGCVCRALPSAWPKLRKTLVLIQYYHDC